MFSRFHFQFALKLQFNGNSGTKKILVGNEACNGKYGTPAGGENKESKEKDQKNE